MSNGYSFANAGIANSQIFYPSMTLNTGTAPAHTPTPKEIVPMAGAAPIKTLHTRYAHTKDGYVGQVVYGDPERMASEGVIAWESQPFPADEDGYASSAKDSALWSAQKALDAAFLSLFAAIPATGPRKVRQVRTTAKRTPQLKGRAAASL